MAQFPQMGAGLPDNPALQSQLTAQFGQMQTLSLQAFDTIQRLNQLNMDLVRQMVEVSFSTCREVMNCQDPTQMAAVAMQQLQPSGERLRDYQHGLFGVIANAQASMPSPAPQASERRRKAAAGEG